MTCTRINCYMQCGCFVLCGAGLAECIVIFCIYLIDYILCNTMLFCFVCGVQRNVHDLCSTEFCGALWLFCARLGCTLWVCTLVVLCNLAVAPWCALCNVAVRCNVVWHALLLSISERGTVSECDHSPTTFSRLLNAIKTTFSRN